MITSKVTRVKTTKISKYEKGPIRRSLFSNGAVTLFHQFKGMNSAVVNLYFLAGSIFESEKEHGIAHVIEHMLFKEKEHGTLLRELEQKGASVNAYTYKEYVCFEMECLGSRLNDFLPLFFKLFFNPVFNEKDLKVEKRVVIQEIKEDKDDHETEGLEILFNKHFPRPLGHPIAGAIKNVSSFTCNDLNKFYNKYFTADRMILSVVSGKTCNQLENILLKSMPTRMAKKKNPFRLNPKKRYGKINHFDSYLKRKMENCVVYYGIDGLSIEHDDYYTLMLLDDLLFEGLTSKFFLLLREKLGIVYGLGSSINSFLNTGNYLMVFNTQKKYLNKLDTNIKDTIEYYSQNPFTEEEINFSKARILDAVEMGFDNMEGRSEFIALEELYGTRDYSTESLKKKMANIDSKSIIVLLKKLKRRGMTRLVLGPK
jgi:predicted Zn-dependent peptidase